MRPRLWRVIQERAQVALAELEGLVVAAPRYGMAAERRRYHQVTHAIEVARAALRRVVMLAGPQG